ncbi:inner membrane protein [Virgibacillus subterraneus]|uniref:Inner membrane protein n=1 Tax=Virgibacillus subterraneus TaxID=621109 RepID=A0A1H9IBA2_9BACI|nr:metal-dependent hydrolase [Virgibacillus subterraneus]SEQ71812.1 inner membrane protein [Virgibacillus subterraneus]
MNGISHATIGSGIGLAVGIFSSADYVTIGSLTLAGVVAALVPDLDTGGNLAKKISFSHKLLQNVMILTGIIMMIYSWVNGIGVEKLIGVGIGFTVIMISKMVSQKMMLLLTGLGAVSLGIMLSTLWITLSGTYVAAASLLPHRSYTHSLIGLSFFSYIAHLFSLSVPVENIFIVCVLGYISHLIADMKLIPTNKRGIPLLLPFPLKF